MKAADTEKKKGSGENNEICKFLVLKFLSYINFSYICNVKAIKNKKNQQSIFRTNHSRSCPRGCDVMLLNSYLTTG